MNLQRPLAAALAASFVLASTSPARAQTYAAPPPPIVYAPPPAPVPYPYGYAPPPRPDYFVGLVPMYLEGDAPGLHYEVVGPKGDERVFGRCVAPCTLQLPPGEYRVRVEGESIPSKQSVVILDAAKRVYSTAGSTSAKNTGLVLAITGTSVAGVGLMVALAAGMTGGCAISECSNSASAQKQRDDARATAGVALAIAGVGALIGTIGWVTFASNRTKTNVSNAFAPTYSFGVAPTVGGASLGFGGAF